MNPTFKPIRKLSLPLAAVVLALGATTSARAAVPALKEDMAQLRTDQAELQRTDSKLIADKAWLTVDGLRGRMSAESPDAMRIYRDQKFIAGERRDIAADTPGSLQWKTDEAALRREGERLEAADHRLAVDRKDGRMAAESPDTLKVYHDQQAIKAFDRQIATDDAKIRADRQS